MYVIVLGAFIFSVAAMRITRYFGLVKWQVSLGFVFLAIVLYFTNIFLIRFFIKKLTPDFNSTEEVIPGIQNWEITAGLGIVPKWVSFIGLLSISSLITAILPWISILIKGLKRII